MSTLPELLIDEGDTLKLLELINKYQFKSLKNFGVISSDLSDKNKELWLMVSNHYKMNRKFKMDRAIFDKELWLITIAEKLARNYDEFLEDIFKNIYDKYIYRYVIKPINIKFELKSRWFFIHWESEEFILGSNNEF